MAAHELVVLVVSFRSLMCWRVQLRAGRALSLRSGSLDRELLAALVGVGDLAGVLVDRGLRDLTALQGGEELAVGLGRCAARCPRIEDRTRARMAMVTSTTATQRQLLFDDGVSPRSARARPQAAYRPVACSWVPC